MLDFEMNLLLIDFGLAQRIYQDTDLQWFDVHWVSEDYSNIQHRTNLDLSVPEKNLLSKLGHEIARVSQAQGISLKASEAKVILPLLTASTTKVAEMATTFSSLNDTIFEVYRSSAQEKKHDIYQMYNKW